MVILQCGAEILYGEGAEKGDRTTTGESGSLAVGTVAAGDIIFSRGAVL
jgi:hypothetical protein